MPPRHCLCHHLFTPGSLHPDTAHLYIADAVRYQARAVTATRQNLIDITTSQCEALYHASSHLGAIALAFRSVDPEHAKATKPTETLSQLAQLWRGTASVLSLSRGLVDPATFSTYLPKVEWTQLTHSVLASQTRVFVDQLRERAQSGNFGTQSDEKSPVGQEAIATYIEALETLRGTFHAEDLDHTRIFASFVIFPPVFLEYVKEGHLLARAILLLYSLAMKQLDVQWWTRPFREQLVDELAPDVAAWDAEMADLASYVRGWTGSQSSQHPLSRPATQT